jgi:predicted transposase YbfD/YdcC
MACALLSAFERMEDPRGYRGRRHRLADIVTIAILASICGASGFADIALFGKSKQKWLRTFLELPAGVPSAATFSRVFAAMNPDAFEACFRLWVSAVAAAIKGVLAIDGKTLRGSLDRAGGKSAIHMVSAWAAGNSVVFGQLAVDEKTNEITAIPALLALLDLKGLIVTIDAMGCQKDIAKTIVAGGGDYLLAVKDNHKGLRDDIEETFTWCRGRNMKGVEHAHSTHTEKGHGRIETRHVTVLWYLGLVRDAAAWANLKCLVEVESQRTVLGGGEDGRDETTMERRYFISSLATRDAERIGAACRAHWGIENGLHWRLDVTFREDERRVRAGHAAENLSRVSRIALNLLKLEPTKESIRGKRLHAGWDHDFLLGVLRMGTE